MCDQVSTHSTVQRTESNRSEKRENVFDSGEKNTKIGDK